MKKIILFSIIDRYIYDCDNRWDLIDRRSFFQRFEDSKERERSIESESKAN